MAFDIVHGVAWTAAAYVAAGALIGVPFLISGGLKIVYDLLLYRNFKKAEVK